MNRLLLSIIAVLATTAPFASRAQIVNGDFEAGGTGWTASGHPDYGVNPFLSTGGNPGGWGVVFCEPAAAGKVSCLRQTFQCGEAGSGTCQIRLDFLAQGIGTGANAAQVIVRLDDQVRFEQAVVGSAGWSTIEFSAESGTHVLDLCLEVLESGGPADNPFWRGGFDNVAALPTVGVEESPWSLVKGLYR